MPKVRPSSAASLGRQLDRLVRELGRVSDDRRALTRTFLSPAMRRANRLVAQWMRATSLQIREDQVGNLIGRLEGPPDAKTLLLGSHLDTVRNAGRFDGAVGVLAPLIALRELARRHVRLPFAVEVLGFSEEEGVRFASAYLGSKGYTGRLRAADLRQRDGDGITVQQVLESFNRGRFRPPSPAHRRTELLGYCEVHIEQGPVLENERLAVGVVSSIAGQTRGVVTFSGRAGHAGTTPMALRADALAGAAELVLAVEAFARATPRLVATVGVLEIPNSASNVIPGEVTLTLDVRHPDNRARNRAVRALLAISGAIARRRRLRFAWRKTQDNPAVACAEALTTELAASVRAVQGRSLSLVSGAGHDGVEISAIAPVAMLFVRCRAGLSHHPAEFASARDLGIGVAALTDFIERLSRRVSPTP